MTKLIDILKPKVSETLLLGQLKSTYETTPGDERSPMLHAEDDRAFGWACDNGHLEIAKWLWAICPDQEQSSMLHADDDYAFREACVEGHQDVAEWLWSICTDQERSTMLHAADDYAFSGVCAHGHQETAKWLWAICSDQEQSAMLHAKDDGSFRWACKYGHIETAEWLWAICSDQEQSAMLHAADDYAFRMACEKGHLELAKWLWSICTDQERSTMLHADDDHAFQWVCYYGHIEIAKWLWDLCQTPEEQPTMLHADDDQAFRGACGNGLETAKWLWKVCPDVEKPAMLHARDNRAFRVACEKGHQKVAEWLWKVCPDLEKPAMLHAADDDAFQCVCYYGHIEIAKWLWDLCKTDEEQAATLHAKDNYAFRMACEKGHLETVKWLWKVCPVEEQSAMLHSEDDYAFRWACEHGHQKIAEWLFDFYKTDVRLRFYKQHVKNGLLWPKLYEYEQIAMFNDQEWLITTIKSNKSIKDVEALISATQSDDVKGVLKTSLYMLSFINIIDTLNEMMPSSDVYHDYFKSCKVFNQNYFINHQMDEVVKKSIEKHDAMLLSKVLNGLEPMDLISERQLVGWLSLAKKEGNAVFQDIYISAVWRGDLYQVLEQECNATHYESLGAVIRVLFKHGVSLSTLMEQVMQDEQAGDQEWWYSLFQGVIINMLTEDPKSITSYQHLLESFCEHPLVGNDNEDPDYQERCLTIITWFESEFQKAANNSSKWTKDELWKMFQQLSLGSGITMGDDHNSRINKLAEFKQKLETALNALDVCSVIDGAGFEANLGYVPNSASTFFCSGEDKREVPSGQVDKPDQKRREDSAAGPSKS